jgi:hypothetical protein
MKFNCSYTELVDIHKLQPHPKNPNKHPESQIKRLAKLIEYQGQRHPVIISKRSGFVVVGHGRLEAIVSLGWKQIAVDYQDFDDDVQEYSFMTSDNAISEWAELDMVMITDQLTEFGPEFTDLELLGLKSVESLKDVFLEEDPSGDEPSKPKQVHCPNCGEEFDPDEHKA